MSDRYSSSATENDLVLKMLRRPEPLYDIEYVSALGGMDFLRLQLADVALSLLVRTSEFREKAMSYRGFNVGAGAMVLQGNRVGRVFGFNAKFDETDSVNIHAEDLVTAKATDAGFDRISVLAVIGPIQEDHVSGRCMPTLHPCGRCREMLRESPLISDDTLIVTAKPDFTAIELATLGGIEKVHEDNDSSGVQSYYFGATPQVFSPLPQPDEHGYIRPSEHEVDDTDWQNTVGQFLIARYVEKIHNKT